MKAKKLIFLALVGLGFFSLTSCNKEVIDPTDSSAAQKTKVDMDELFPEKSVFCKYYNKAYPSENYYYEIYVEKETNKPKWKIYDNGKETIIDIEFVSKNYFIGNSKLFYCDGYIFYSISASYVFTSETPQPQKRSTESTPTPSSSSSSEAR